MRLSATLIPRRWSSLCLVAIALGRKIVTQPVASRAIPSLSDSPVAPSLAAGKAHPLAPVLAIRRPILALPTTTTRTAALQPPIGSRGATVRSEEGGVLA
jgi:hypothetical protein